MTQPSDKYVFPAIAMGVAANFAIAIFQSDYQTTKLNILQNQVNQQILLQQNQINALNASALKMQDAITLLTVQTRELQLSKKDKQ